jgi:glycosyltransferase involved in cell wall biosynthesis
MWPRIDEIVMLRPSRAAERLGDAALIASHDARPRISVIIPSFGRPLSLERAAASALAELTTEDELLIIDDGSEPPVALSKKLADDPRVRLIRSDQNRGAASARNLGIAHARHGLVAFLDSDDRWIPGKIDAQLELLAATPTDRPVAVSCGWIDTKDGLPVRTRVPRSSRSRQDFFAGNWFAPGATLLIDKSAFALCGPFREDLPRLEDYEWFIRFALAGGRLVAPRAIGAEIAVGTNARPGPVDAAATRIGALYRQDSRLQSAERRKMTAFLALVRAVGARNGKLWAAFGLHLMQSFMASPRLSIHLGDWWPEAEGRNSPE